MAKLTEDELIETLRRLLPVDAADVPVGPGDDAAVVDLGDRFGVLTVDMLVEGIDFDLAWMSARDLGYKAIAVGVSDVAAMAASPRHAVVALGLPPESDSGWVVELYGGIREAADEHALAVVGGDLSASDRVIVSVTVTGEAAKGAIVTRAGGRAGDRVVVTGSLGSAAGGLALLRAGPKLVAESRAAGWGTDLLQALFRPVARVGEARILARAGASAMIDVSDGLAKDLGRVCARSGVGGAIAPSRLPIAGALSELEKPAGIDARSLALTGGEDFELLATLPPGTVEAAAAALAERFGTALTDIGELREGAGLVAVGDDGSERPLEPGGWDHFAR